MAKLPDDDLLIHYLTIRPQWTSTEVGDQFGVSRQAAHDRLSLLVAKGLISRTGRARATRYRVIDRPLVRATLRLEDLEEDVVWNRLSASLTETVGFSPEGLARFQYAFTEMLNNAIEHSQGTQVDVQFALSKRNGEDLLQFVLADNGVGVFRRIQERLQLDSPFDAVIELTKGKFTTDPEAHSGEGIFFTSKVARVFEIESEEVRFVVDNLLEDTAVAVPPEPSERGTIVRFSDNPRATQSPEQVFARFTEDFRFVRTHPVVKLVSYGERLISRSEARRLVARLEQFEHVTLDFSGVLGVGQGFVDEVFRVFGQRHPEIVLEPIHMNDAVEFMVKRGLGQQMRV